MNRIYSIITLIIVQFAHGDILFAQKNIEVCVNKNIELLFSMQIQSKMDDIILSKGYAAFPLTTQLDFQLKRDYQNTFKKFNSSSQIEYFNDLIEKGFIFNDPFNCILMMDSSMKVSNLCWLHGIPFPQSTKDSILIFIAKMKEFKDLSSFDEFYEKNIPIYNTIVKDQEAKVALSTLVYSIEEFFGWGLPGYHLVLVPMMWPGGISVEYKEQCEDRIGHSYIFIGPKKIIENRPDFGTADEFKSVVLHEFIHPFVMKYCIQHRGLIEQYSDLYQSNQEVYQNNAIPDWFNAVNEILTRTVEIILHAQTNKEKVKELIDYQSKLGFKYIPILYDAIERYYPNDKRSSISLNDVFNDIITSLGKMDKID